MEKYYIEVTDERVEEGQQYIYQSCIFENKEEALKFGRRLAQSFGRSDISMLRRDLDTTDYLDPDWEFSAKGAKKNLHIDLMVMEYFNNDEEYEIYIEEMIK